MTVADVAGRNQTPLGIAYMVGSTVMFAGGNAVVKWQLANYPLGEVAFGRTLFAFLTAVAIVLPHVEWSVLRTRRYREYLQRGLSQFGSMPCWFIAVGVLSLGSATDRYGVRARSAAERRRLTGTFNAAVLWPVCSQEMLEKRRIACR